jgi:anti-sigma factor RsiW
MKRRRGPGIERLVTCQDFASFILEYLENELQPATRATFEHHLSICPNCVRYLAHYEATVAAGRSAFQEPDGVLPQDVPDELVRAILAARGR